MEINVRKKVKQPLSREAILDKISAYDIYRYYCGNRWKLNKEFSSPLRNDNNPSFLISSRHGHLYHIDFANINFKGDCFDLVKQIYGVDYYRAMEIIDRDFGLGISSKTDVGKYKRIRSEYTQPELQDNERYNSIQVLRKSFTSLELSYWNSYHITQEDLSNEQVYSVGKLYLNKEQLKMKSSEMVFGYLYKDKYWKIYRPLEVEKKWMSSVPIDVMDGLENIIGCEKAIVTKSKKDLLVLKKILPCVCAVQNESMIALNDTSTEHLKNNAKEVYLNYDCDEPGVRNSLLVTEKHGFKYLNVPKIYLEQGIKDFADLGRAKGLDVVREYIKSKGII